ncbi:MAG: hypothetical protein KTR35_16625 [Gammaproteobacteria bacterium]|nr:hypothetical protein [Gammaproteobacteria bacterium]
MKGKLTTVLQKTKRRSKTVPADAFSVRDYRKLIELFVFSGLAPLVGVFLFSSDPLGLNSGFPWGAALPVIFAARYGSSWGLSCALLSILFFSFPYGAYAESVGSIVVLSIGTLVMCILVGDSATSWRKRAHQADAENQYLRHRLKEFSNDYHVLKVSHGQLEEYMAGQRMSLRQALQNLKPVLASTPDGLEAGSDLMAVFAQFCSVQIAGLYAMKSDSTLDPNAIALHGDMEELSQFDPLLRLALQERKLVSVKLESLATETHQTGLLAVVPIVDSQDNLHGVLAIKDMHFLAFQQQNLNILSLLAGYVGDMLTRSKGMGSSQTSTFFAEMDTAIRYSKTHSVQSTLMCLQLVKFQHSALIAKRIANNIRSLDSSWIPKTVNEHDTVVLLLPLMTEDQSLAYRRRISESIKSEFKLDLERILFSSSVKQIDAKDTRESCLEFIGQSTGVSGYIEPDEPNNIEKGDDKGLESVA